MRRKFLKVFRVIVSLLFLVFTSFIFVDFASTLSKQIINGVTFLQFVPSVLKFINLLSIGTIGFLIVLAFTFLFGRVYCSTVCPLGIMQDVISYLSRKFSKRKKIFRYSGSHTWLRYSLLVVTAVLLLFGSVFALNLLDPFSNFGKIFSDLVRPVYFGLNNVSAKILNSFGIYSLYKVETGQLNYLTLIYPALFFGLVFWLSFRKGRLYCNTVCPVGTFLGLVSKASLYKVSIDENNCTRCGKCSVVCKSGCIDVKNKKVDFSRCVGCFNCLDACPTLGIDYHNSWFGKRKSLVMEEVTVKPANTDTGKRDFLVKSIAFLAGLGSISKVLRAQSGTTVVVTKASTVAEKKNYAVSPPGSIGLEHFNETCTACHLCVSACPTHVLQPAFLEYGLTGMMQPRMDYHTNFCNYECTTCADVCPAGAIMPLTEEAKKTTQIGKVIFEKDNCVVKVEGTSCGACAEHCPTKAVHMVPYEGDLKIPETDQDICIGCGACEHACPTRPYRAIYVDGDFKHQVAELPKEEKLEAPDEEEDFPF